MRHANQKHLNSFHISGVIAYSLKIMQLWSIYTLKLRGTKRFKMIAFRGCSCCNVYVETVYIGFEYFMIALDWG